MNSMMSEVTLAIVSLVSAHGELTGDANFNSNARKMSYRSTQGCLLNDPDTAFKGSLK